MVQHPIRILMVVTQMNRAGIENLLMNLYRHIDREKIQFDFYTVRMEKGEYDDEIFALGGKVYYNPPFSVQKLYEIPKRIKRFCEAHPEYQIVHAHMNQWCGLILKGAKEAKVPVRVAHAHTSLVKGSLKNFAKNIIKLQTNRYANRKLAISNNSGVWLYGARAVARGEVSIWKNTVQPEKFTFSQTIRQEKREELGLSNEFALIHIGNLRPEKNHPYLFRVFAEILKNREDSRLILVGNEPQDCGLRALAKKLGILEKILFLGSRADVAQLLQAGDVLAFPSFYEGFPTAILEAQAAGIPCVISDTITNEVCVTPLVEMRSIREKPCVWADAILSKKLERIDYTDAIVQAGYSLPDFVKTAQEFYLSEMERICYDA